MLESKSKLNEVLSQTENGLQIVGKHLIPEKPMDSRPLPIIREDYLSAMDADEVQAHNLRYAKGLEKEPRLLLSWLMLPIRCNQNCHGCYAGKDRARMNYRLPKVYSQEQLAETFASLKRFGVQTLGYAGMGELFTMQKPFSPMNWREYVDLVLSAGFKMLIFTNGTLLTKEDVEWLAERPISLIFSWRDTHEVGHDQIVRTRNSFQKSVRALKFALELGTHQDNRIGVEIPVVRDNLDRVLYDFIPAMRHIGVIPYAEMFMHVYTTPEEKKVGLDFAEARDFFRRAQEVEKKLGYVHAPCFGQRMISQKPCGRPSFSVTIHPDGLVTPCPGSSVELGNLSDGSLDDILLSQEYQKWQRDFKLCACSTFYTEDNKQIPSDLPSFLKGFCEE